VFLRGRDKDIYYILHRDIMPKTGVSLYPEADLNKSKYSQFKGPGTCFIGGKSISCLEGNMD